MTKPFHEELKTTIIVDKHGQIFNLPEGWTLDMTLFMDQVRADAKRQHEGYEKRIAALTEPPKQDVKLAMGVVAPWHIDADIVRAIQADAYVVPLNRMGGEGIF